MVTGDFWVLLAMLLYFIVVVLIGFVYAKKSNASSEAYFLGGRGLGPWLTALSAEASDMSGWLLMGLPGVAYFTGASDAMWTAIGLAIGTYLNWKFVAKRLRKYSEVANNSITVPDFFSNRFHDNKHVLMTIAAIITLVFFSIYTGSCFVTCGKLFSTLFGLDYATMMVLGAIIVFLYTFVGGYLSVCTTDLIQGTLMFFALATVFIGSVAQAGGVENTVAFLQDIPGYLSGTQIATPILDAAGNQVVENGAPLFGAAGEYGLITIVSGLAWGLGYFGMPQVLVRFMSVRHSDEIKKSRIIAIDLAGGVAFERGVHRPYRARRHPDGVPHAVCRGKRLRRALAHDSAILRLRSRRFGHLRRGDELLVFLSAHFRLGGRNEHLQGPDQARRDRSPGYDRRPFHLGGRSSVRHHHRDGFQFVHLQRRVLRMGGLRCVVWPPRAVLPVLEAHDAARWYRRYARRCCIGLRVA